VYSKIKIAGHPVHLMLVAFPLACCTGARLTRGVMWASRSHGTRSRVTGRA